MALGRDEVIDQLVQLVDHLGRPADALAPSPGRSGRPRLVDTFARKLANCAALQLQSPRFRGGCAT
jgi:hypothetical protein